MDNFFIALCMLLMTGSATCSVLGHGCPTDITCESLNGCEEANTYKTTVEIEGTECEWCPVCITTTSLDSNGCPDREQMCEGQAAIPESCKAKVSYKYNDSTCNHCDEDFCVNYSDEQFVGSNK